MDLTGTILVVEDQVELLENIGMTLASAGFNALIAKDGMEALDLLARNQVDLILADIAMPRLNGYQLYERVREEPAWVAIPFVFLTARALDSDVRYGKELGVDDYLTKPIQPEDLLAAVRGRLRRAQQLSRSAPHPASNGTPPSTLLTLGSLKIDPHQHQVSLNDEPIKLSAREFKILVTLAEQPGNVVAPTDLIRVTHEFEADPIEAGTLLRPLIRSLRRKLGYEVGEMGCIENIRGVGYRLVPPA